MLVFAESIIYDSKDMLYIGDAISNWGFENEHLLEISVCLSHQIHTLPVLSKEKSLIPYTEEISENRVTL